jgi:hypothetical protein
VIGAYLNQRIGWRRRTGIKDNGQPLFDDLTAIPARVEYKRRLVRNAKAEEVMSEGFAMTRAAVSVGDVLVWEGREWPVINASAKYGLMGGETHREVYF